jgi:hypothetical protein
VDAKQIAQERAAGDERTHYNLRDKGVDAMARKGRILASYASIAVILAMVFGEAAAVAVLAGAEPATWRRISAMLAMAVGGLLVCFPVLYDSARTLVANLGGDLSYAGLIAVLISVLLAALIVAAGFL